MDKKEVLLNEIATLYGYQMHKDGNNYICENDINKIEVSGLNGMLGAWLPTLEKSNKKNAKKTENKYSIWSEEKIRFIYENCQPIIKSYSFI